MHVTLASRPSPALRLTVALFLAGWMLVAAFPLAWVAIMSFRLPVDALSSAPMDVLLGPRTLQSGAGLGVLDIALPVLAALAAWRLAPRGRTWLTGGAIALAVLASLAALPALDALPGLRVLATPMLGWTGQHYRAVWIGHEFYRNFLNSALVTAGVVSISLSVGTLAGYALARSGSVLAFWLLIAALVFRALPHSVLVAGYLPAFIGSREILQPAWDAPLLGAVLHLFADAPPTLYGRPWAIIAVLVSINQPFTIWMLRSFFRGIPAELDEAARVDGCSHFEAFRRVVMPVMWPGVVTAGLFSFLLAYNDYLVCALLLDAQSQTMVPAITSYFNRETTSTDQIEAVAAAVSITAPLFLLVMAFQRQIVSGLTSGAVKG